MTPPADPAWVTCLRRWRTLRFPPARRDACAPPAVRGARVRDPRAEGEVAISLPLQDEAISTSGDYERFFIEGETRYHHIIQPSTGEPASGVHSATVMGPDAVITDALSTSVFVLGVDQGLRLVATLPDYESIVIDAEGRIFYSDGLQPPSP